MLAAIGSELDDGLSIVADMRTDNVGFGDLIVGGNFYDNGGFIFYMNKAYCEKRWSYHYSNAYTYGTKAISFVPNSNYT
jgi:hypothetical protein